MSKEIQESLDLLSKDWDVDPILYDFMIGKVQDVTDHKLVVGSVIFHVPYIESIKKHVLWKCFWPDCHNCCNRQGRLPLTADDLITIGAGLKYQKTSDFIKQETILATYTEPAPSGANTTITTINLKRKNDETEKDDGTHIPCRFLDDQGGCSMHPDRPGVCYMYPFSAWLENDNGRVRVHATYQFTGDCPGFYLEESLSAMRKEFEEYSQIIYNYSMKSNKTMRDGYGSVSFG